MKQTLKQRRRRENKKRKMIALNMISSLNEADRMKAMLKATGAGIPLTNELHINDEEEMKKDSRKRKFEEINDGCVKGNPTIAKRHLADDELKELKILSRQRFAAKKKLPKIIMKVPGLQAMIDHPSEHRIPLFLSDVQHFILYTLHGHMSTGNIPRWINIEKHGNIKTILFLIVEGMSLTDYKKYENLCPKLKQFSHKLEVITPLAYGGYLIRETATLPLTESQRHKLEKRFGSIGGALSSSRVIKALRTMFPFGFDKNCCKYEAIQNDESIVNEKKGHAFSRTELLLSPWQMLEEGYPLLLDGQLKNKYFDYVYTKQEYKEVSPYSPMWAVDCEMCVTKQGSELTRITIVNEELEVMYETFVKPHNPIIDYVTRYSGITAKHLEHVTKRLEDVQADLRNLLPPDVILVGHSLNMDFYALKVLHPYIIDTSVIFNLSGNRARKTKLKVLVAEFLGEQIQMGDNGHDSAEDARACMKLLNAKLQHSVEWGDAVISGTERVRALIAQRRRLHAKNDKLRQDAEKLRKEATKFFQVEDQKIDENQVNIVKVYSSLPKYVQADSICQVQMFTTSLFSHLITRDKKCLLVAKSSVVGEFVKYMPETLRPFQPESRVTISAQETNKAIVKFGRNNAPESGVTVMYNVIERKPEQTATKVDQLVTKLTKDLTGNVLVAVLLAGRTTAFDEVDSTNRGMLLIDLHQEVIPPIQLKNDVSINNTTPLNCQSVC